MTKVPYRVSQKTHFLNCVLAKPGLRVHCLPLPVGCLTGSGRLCTLKPSFAKTQFRKCVFRDTLYYKCNIKTKHVKCLFIYLNKLAKQDSLVKAEKRVNLILPNCLSKLIEKSSFLGSNAVSSMKWLDPNLIKPILLRHCRDLLCIGDQPYNFFIKLSHIATRHLHSPGKYHIWKVHSHSNKAKNF